VNYFRFKKISKNFRTIFKLLINNVKGYVYAPLVINAAINVLDVKTNKKIVLKSQDIQVLIYVIRKITDVPLNVKNINNVPINVMKFLIMIVKYLIIVIVAINARKNVSIVTINADYKSIKIIVFINVK
jgi:hypothetical protein